MFKCLFKQTLGQCQPVVETITIKDEIYDKLAGLKRGNDGFSNLFERLTECQDSRQLPFRLKGSVGLTDEEKVKMLSGIYFKNPERTY